MHPSQDPAGPPYVPPSQPAAEPEALPGAWSGPVPGTPPEPLPGPFSTPPGSHQPDPLPGPFSTPPGTRPPDPGPDAYAAPQPPDPDAYAAPQPPGSSGESLPGAFATPPSAYPGPAPGVFPDAQAGAYPYPYAYPEPQAGPVRWSPQRLRLPGARRPWRRTLTVAAALIAVISVLGAPLGLLWAWLAPEVPVISVGEPGVVVNDPSPEQYIAADGWFTLLGLGFGVLVAIVAWLVLRRDRGPFLLFGVIIGTSLAVQRVAPFVGEMIGRADYEEWQSTAAQGATYLAPPELHAFGPTLVPAFAAAVVLTLLAGWSNDPDLDHPGAQPGYGPNHPGYPPPYDPAAHGPAAGYGPGAQGPGVHGPESHGPAAGYGPGAQGPGVHGPESHGPAAGYGPGAHGPGAPYGTGTHPGPAPIEAAHGVSGPRSPAHAHDDDEPVVIGGDFPENGPADPNKPV